MKKITSIVWILVSLFFVLTGCNPEQTFDMDQVVITAPDQINVPAGQYTLQYTIENLSDLVKNHGASVTVEVKDKSNQLVTLTGNQIVVEANQVYTVKVTVTIEGETVFKTFTITAVTSNVTTHTVTYDVQGGTPQIEPQIVAHGTTVLIPVHEPMKTGYQFVGWFLDTNRQTPVTQDTLVTADMTIYAGYIALDSLATVTFVTNGANESFPAIQVNKGDFLPAIQTPTKTGYRFDGWYLEASLDTPVQIELTQIYQDTTLYAKWVDTTIPTFVITYDLNGAIQTSTITETVLQNDQAKGFGTTPVRTGYRLEGYSETPDGAVLYDFETPVTKDMTLYAIWLFNYTEIENVSYFETTQFSDDSYLDPNCIAIQRYLLQNYVRIKGFKDAQGLTEKVTSYGFLYAETELLTVQQRGITKINSNPLSDAVHSIDIRLQTSTLKSNTTYYYRLYVILENTILYSDVSTFETAILVEGGFAVGLNGVVSGGEYYLSDPQVSQPLSFFYEVLEGYEAVDNDILRPQYVSTSIQGDHSVIVTDLATQLQYQHIYKLKFNKPFVSSRWYQTQIINSSSVKLEFNVVLLHEDRYSYPISDAGFLYSRTTFALIKGVPGVHDADADYKAEQSLIYSTESLDFSNQELYYVRSYVVLSGNIHYSDYLYEFTFDTAENTYRVSKTIKIEHQKMNQEYPYEYYLGNTPHDLHYYDGTQVTKSTYSGTGSFVAPGLYFSYPKTTSMISVIEIESSYPELQGVVNQGVYDGPITIEYLMPNVYWYMAFNGGDYVYLPHRVRLEKPGYYELFYRSVTGMKSIGFEIK